MTAPPEMLMPLPLLLAYAPQDRRDWLALCWRIDDRLARIVLTAREPAVAAISLAWWEEVLTGARPEGQGEPLVEAWRARSAGTEQAPAVMAIAAAWRMLLDPEPMRGGDWREFARQHAQLFAMISGHALTPAHHDVAGLWSLWNCAARDPDRERATQAMAAALTMLPNGAAEKGLIKPLRLAYQLARDDVMRQRVPDGGFRPRQYIRLLMHALIR